MTELKGLHDQQQDRLRNWLGHFDTDNFLVTNDSHSANGNLLDDDAQQGLLTTGLPTAQFQGPITFPHCLFWLPDFCPDGKSVHLASSRLGNRPDQKKAIFDAMRTVAGQENVQFFLVTHTRTSLHNYTTRLAELFNLPLLTLSPMPNRMDSDWFRRQLLRGANNNVCYYFALDDTAPNPDELLFGACTEVRVLSARAGGNIASCATARLNSQDPNRCQTFVLVQPALTPPKLMHSLQLSGAIDWWMYQQDGAITEPAAIANSIQPLSEFSAKSQVGDFMIHWTRQRIGPWPYQAENEFIDGLLLGVDEMDQSRISTLCRIVACGRLIANNQFVRSDIPVVCFADLPVDQLIAKRVFRSHLGRWDFEPCGIAIRKSVLRRRGIKPVIYGDDDTWNQLSTEEQPFFQVERSTSPKGKTIDWTEENEHRICGNVALDQIGADDAFLFVETRDEAQIVARLSRWPVVVLSE